MLTLQIPMLLALLATALMAVVIFAPTRVAASPTISFAPPPAPPPTERWEPADLMTTAHPWDGPPIESWPADVSPADASPADGSRADTPVSTAPEWPTLVDVRAANCDATARLAIVDALAAVRAPWAHAILCSAADDDPDELVRCAAASALRA